MRLFILCAILAPTLATPNGFYHQAYNYRTSSSSYKNNELQHRNDDEGFYAKDGDVEGRFRPRVNAHSQHSEYVNPKLQHAYRIGTDRTSSFGQLHAQNRYQPGEPPFDRPEVTGAGFAYAPQQNYGVSSDLRQVTAGLQTEIEQELQRAVYDHYQRAAAYGGSISQAQVEADRRVLEEELRRNMTMRLQEALKTQYGNQGVRGAYSYSIMNGRLQPTANYHNQELEDLTRQMEERLMRHLEQQVQTYYHTRVDTQVHRQTNTYRQVNGEGVNGNYPRQVNGEGVNGNYPSPLQQRPVYHQYPQSQHRPMPVQQPHPMPVQQPHPMPVQQPHPMPVQPHPVAPIPDSITTVATRVQTELNEILNKILEDTQRRYFAENSYNAGVNYDGVLARLQDELRANITFHFDDQIKRAYGYTNYASKYSMEDIENLRRQIETNLVTKLNRDFTRQREKFLQTHHMYVAQHSQPIPVTHVIPGHQVIPGNQVMPGNHVFYPVNNVQYNRENNAQYNREIVEMQRQLQEQLSRQLQTALMQQSYRQAHMYTNAGSNFNPQAHYQATLDQLSAELSRNLTRQMEVLNTQQYQSGAYGAQLAQMRSQLQHELMQQLQQGLQQSFSRYSSWSSSSSHSSRSNANYRPVRGFDPNLYRMYGGASDAMGEDCMMGDDPSAYRQTEDHDLTQQAEILDQALTQQAQTHDDLTQHTQDDDDLTQQVQSHDDLTQQVQSHDDLTQQVQSRDDLTQQVLSHDDLTQQDQDNLTQQVQSHDDLTQQVQSHDDLIHPVQSHDDLTQQVQSNDDLTQQVQSDDDLIQQVQSHDDLTQQVQSHDDLTQQVQSPNDFTQQVQNQRQLRPLYSRPRPIPQPQNPQSQPINNWKPQQYQTYSQRVPPVEQPQPVVPVVSAIQQPSQDWTQDPTQQTQSHDDLTQQVQTQEYPGTQQIQDLSQQSQISPISQPVYEQPHQVQSLYQIYPQHPESLPSRPAQIRYQVYRTQPQTVEPLYQPQQTYAQATRNTYRPRQEPNRYDSPQYTSVYQWQSQQQTPPGNTVGQRVQYYERLGRHRYPYTQQNYYQAPKPYSPINNERQNLLGQQNEDLSQQIQEPGLQPTDFTQQSLQGQQSQDLTQQSRDLTQQTEDTEFAPLQIGNSGDKDNSGFRTESLKLADQQSPGNLGGLTQQQAQVFASQQNQDLTQQNQDLTQQTEDLTQQSQDLTQQSQDLTQQSRDLTENPFLNQQSQDLTQQTEDLSPQYQDLTQQSQDLIQQNQELTAPNQYLNQQIQDLTQQSQGLTQQTQDLTQQNDDLTQQSQDLTQQSQDLTQQSEDLTQQTQDLSQQTEDVTQKSQQLDQQNQDTPSPFYIEQTQDVTQDLTQQIEDIDQPIEAQVASNKIIEQPSQQLQQNQDLTQQQQNEPTITPGFVQQQNVPQQSNQRLSEAQRESQRLIDLLRNEQQEQQQLQQQYQQQPQYDGLSHHSPSPVYANIDGQPVQVGTTRRSQPNQIPVDVPQDTQGQEPIGPVQYQPRPVYADFEGHQHQAGTTRQLPSGRSLKGQEPNQVNYGRTVAEPDNVETTGNIEPTQPQVASEVQQVDDATVTEVEEPEITTKKPGWWTRMKNKLG